MSGAFGDREKGFENKWAHDEDLRFKVYARRNKLLGLWAAAQMGLSDIDADAYAKEVVKSDFEKPGEEDVFEKIHKDLLANGLNVSDHTVRRTMDELLATAKEQIRSEVA